MQTDSACSLCTAVNQTYRVVEKREVSYALVPLYPFPLAEGYVMILPKRHTKMESLNQKELLELRDFSIDFKNKLEILYPLHYTLLFTNMDGKNASIPEHFHYHLGAFPEPTLETFHKAHPEIPQKRKNSLAELERMAKLLR